MMKLRFNDSSAQNIIKIAFLCYRSVGHSSIVSTGRALFRYFVSGRKTLAIWADDGSLRFSDL